MAGSWLMVSDRERLDRIEYEWYQVALDYGRSARELSLAIETEDRDYLIAVRRDCVEQSDKILDEWLDFTAELGRIGLLEN